MEKHVLIKAPITFNNDVNMTVGGDMIIEEPLTLKAWGQINIKSPHQKVVFNGPVTLHNHTKITIEGDAEINGELHQQGQNGRICVKGNTHMSEDQAKRYAHILSCS